VSLLWEKVEKKLTLIFMVVNRYRPSAKTGMFLATFLLQTLCDEATGLREMTYTTKLAILPSQSGIT